MLSECFQSQGNIGKQSKKWTLKEIFHNSFRKLRITKKNKDTPLSLLFDKRLALKERLTNSGDEENTKNELDEVEDNISKEVSKDNRDKVMEAFRDLTDTDGSIHINGLWSLKNKTFQKHTKKNNILSI